MSPEQALEACHAPCALHIRRAMPRLIWWTVDGVFDDMFVCVHEDMHPGCSDPMDPHRVLSTASSTLWISLCIKGLYTDKQQPLKRPLEGRLRAWNCVNGAEHTLLLYGVHGPCTRPHKTGDRTVCQTCARSVRHPVTAADAAWRDTGAKRACHVVPPQPRLIRANRQALSRVSEAVPPQRPVGQPGVVPPVFPFVTPLCPPYAP